MTVYTEWYNYDNNELRCTYQHNRMNLQWEGVSGGFHIQRHRYSLHQLYIQQVVHRGLAHMNYDLNRHNMITIMQ